MLIKISDPKGEKSFFIRRMFAFSAVKKLNEAGMIKLSFPDDLAGLEEFEIKKGFLIQAFLPDEKKKVHCIFSGYIEERSIVGNVVNLVGYDFIGYAKHRMIREDLKFQNTAIKSIVETIFWKLNAVSVLPFSLGKNDGEELINIEFKAFTSLYTILKELSKKVSDLQIRHRSEIVGNGSKEYLDISKNCGVQHSWIWSDNANIQQRNSKVVSREWKDSLWNTCNYWRDNNGNIRENQSSISQWLLFEKFEQNPEKTPDELVESAGLVTIVPEVSREEMTQLTVGDQKAIRLIARLEWARFEYLGIIQEVSFGSNSAGGLDFSIKIWEKLIEQKNILDKTLANLASAVKKSWPSNTPAPQVDLSWYATSSAVNQAIQSQNTKIEQKADSSFVQWVAQTAQTALNTANEAKQTAESKAPIQHTHSWNELLNKPETFTPSTHKHKIGDIENITEIITQEAVKKALGEVSSDQDGYLTSGDYNKIFPKNWETRGNPLDYEKMTINTMGANRLAFLNPEQVLVETSTDWTNWGEYALADNKKRNLFNGLNGSNDEIQVGKDMQIRVTLDSWINNKSERYVTLEKLYLRTTTSGDNISVKIEKANVGAPDKWILVSDYSGGASNRPGNIVVQHPSILFGSFNPQQTNNWRKVRITIKVVNPQTKFARYKRWLWGIKRFGMSAYTSSNNMMKYGSLFSWDNDQNAIFPGLVKSSATPRSQEDLVNKKYVDDLDIPTVPAWAKQENKPTYTISEIQGLQEALENKSSSVASLDRIDFNYTTNLTQKKFRIGSRHQFSNVPHDQGGHQIQVLWWDLQPQGTGHDGGWWLMFWPDQNPYLQMQGEHTYLGRTDWWIKTRNWINPPNHMGMHRGANTDRAQIVFNSNNNDDTALDFKLGDDGSEWFRFMYIDTWRAAFNYELATFKQKFFAHAHGEYGEFPNISLAIWDSDTGFNRESDGVLSYFSNGSKIQTIHQNAVPVVAEDFGRNVKFKKLTQAQYDALGAGRPNNVIYYITD